MATEVGFSAIVEVNGQETKLEVRLDRFGCLIVSVSEVREVLVDLGELRDWIKGLKMNYVGQFTKLIA